MKKLFFFTIMLCFSVSSGFAQKSASPVKSIKPKPIRTSVTLTEISGAEWKNLTDALKAEMWEKSAQLAARYLREIKIENNKKQLAQLRYFYLYALAGKILAFSDAKLAVEENAAWAELDAAIGNFTGKEFVLPPHQFLSDCKNSVNYICAVEDNDRALRITETNRAGTAIHSFDYVLLNEKISPDKLIADKIFLGGNLKRAEFNQDLSKRWVMRLIFEKGFVNFAAPDDK